MACVDISTVAGVNGFFGQSCSVIAFRFVISCLCEIRIRHLAHLILTKMTASIPLNDVCFGSGNNAVPNQNDGNWKVNCRMIRSIRGETAAIKATIRRHAEAWFPRAENTRADLLSMLALTGQEVTEAGWVAELDELLHDFENEPNE